MSPAETCPYQVITESGRMLCFDSTLVRGIERPGHIVEKYCKGDFHACPYYQTFVGGRPARAASII